MYFCICKKVTEAEVKSLSAQGAVGKEKLKRLGVGNDCGICVLSENGCPNNKQESSRPQNNSKNPSKTQT
jgi:bacterioferritin-associated ferredoxin